MDIELEGYLDELDMLIASDFELDHPRIIQLQQRINKLMEEQSDEC